MNQFAANALQCIVSGEENPKLPLPHWDFVALPEEDRVTAIGNTHRKIGKELGLGFGSGDILADRQTNKHTQTDTHICAHHNTSPLITRAK